MNIFDVKPKIQPSKGILNTTEKCPHCLMGFMDFMDIGRTLGLAKGVLLGCYACGGVFVTKETCDLEKAGKKEMLECQEKKEKWEIVLPVEKPEYEWMVETKNANSLIPLTTKCGKEMKTELSKTRHEKVCKKCKEISNA